MKKWMSLMLIGLGAVAMADIPTPTTDVLTVTGAEAAQLAASLPGDYEGSTEGFFATRTKKLRTSQGLTQILCSQTYKNGRLANEQCQFQKSGNGVPLRNQ